MYPEFDAVARPNGFTEIAANLGTIAIAGKRHEMLYLKLAKLAACEHGREYFEPLIEEVL